MRPRNRVDGMPHNSNGNVGRSRFVLSDSLTNHPIAMCFPRALIGALTVLLISFPVAAHDARDPPLRGAIYPKISPDGETVAFTHQGAIWRIQVNGGAMSRLTHAEGYDSWPAWSPDGKRIAFVAGRGFEIGPLQVIAAMDGETIPLPKYPAAKSKLTFSPDGQRLLGIFRQENSGFALRWFDIDSGVVGDALYPDTPRLAHGLSPDGTEIVMSTTLDAPPEQQGGNNGPECDLWMMPAEGGEPTKLARFPGRIYDITWSADGESLFIVSSVGGAHNDLWQVPLHDPVRGAVKRTFGLADEDGPSTDSGGQRLVFTDNRHGPTELIVRDLQSNHDSTITVSSRDYGRPSGKLSLQFHDSDTSAPVTARVTLKQVGGKYHAPPDAIYRMLGTDIHFYSDGGGSLDVPAGSYLVKVARGPEYPVLRREIDVPADGKVDETFLLERWTHQRARNWYSGESHIHANYGYGHWYNSPQTMLAQSSGEDLIVSNFMVANSDSDGVYDREYFRGSPDPLSNDDHVLYWNEEFRSTIWGHMTLLNLKQLVEPIFTGFAHTTNPHDHPSNADIADHTHDQHGHVNYTHPAQNVKDPYLTAYSAKALPLDVALGKVDSVDVMGSNHEANMAVWYRLLNCGFHVPASAGTDCFLNRVRGRLPGQVRVYVYVEGEFRYQRFARGQNVRYRWTDD